MIDDIFSPYMNDDFFASLAQKLSINNNKKSSSYDGNTPAETHVNIFTFWPLTSTVALPTLLHEQSLLMSQSTPIHFDLSYSPVRFHDYLLHGCDKISPPTDWQSDKSGKTLKTASALVSATKSVSRTTFCRYDTHTHTQIHRVGTSPADTVTASKHPLLTKWLLQTLVSPHNYTIPIM